MEHLEHTSRVYSKKPALRPKKSSGNSFGTLAQLKVGGRMIIPVGEQAWVQSLYIVEKRGPKDFKIEDVMAVAFVPLTGTH